MIIIQYIYQYALKKTIILSKIHILIIFSLILKDSIEIRIP